MNSVTDEPFFQFWQIENQISKYFFTSSAACPYGLDYKATYRYLHFGVPVGHIFESFLAHGFRRNGNCLYTMICDECKGCVSIRLAPDKFLPNRNQRRVWKKNQDLSVTLSPLTFDQEQFDLCDKFLNSRFPGKESKGADYYSGFFNNSVVDTLEIRYAYGDKLIGVTVVDIGQNYLNAVYFYFDPDEAKRSPGTFNVLYMIEMCKQYGIANLYLGYTIDEVPAMSYKNSFKPHSLLADDCWHLVDSVNRQPQTANRQPSTVNRS